MGLFGKKKEAKSSAKAGKVTPKKSAKATAQSAEAKKILEKMKAKSDAGDCAFC